MTRRSGLAIQRGGRPAARGALAAWLLVCLLSTVSAAQTRAARQSIGPELFTYTELAALYVGADLPAPLADKLQRLLTTPFVDNSHAGEGRPPLARHPQLGEHLRVAFWNIERGLEYEAIEAAFGDEQGFAALLDPALFPVGSKERAEVLGQAALLRAADVIVLNEVDWGLKRTAYRHVAAELAARLKMNYAFGAQFVELSPVALSAVPPREDDEEEELRELMTVDPARYKGLHGVAILSRFPLENVRLVPFKHQPYDWYKRERDGASLLERGKREASKRVFLEETLREVRRGGRMMLLADISDERLPAGRVTVAATHLEARTTPAHRARQLEEVLAEIKPVPHPVVLAGDMNTSTSDLTPTSLWREIRKRVGSKNFWLHRGINYFLGVGLVKDAAIGGVGFARTHADPTVRHVPLVSPNPEAKFFTQLEEFRFADGGAFDFRGDRARAWGGRAGKLANSNERGGKGFATTYEVSRPVAFVGKYKLDWIFVKPAALTAPDDGEQSYRFAPHFGRTLRALNESVAGRISDHSPLVVDLPLAEPPPAGAIAEGPPARAKR
jgi:endonuclease/exonuclease/phosphatase family metal-dependent hydrolase